VLIGGGVYALEGGVRDQASSLSNEVASLNQTNNSLQTSLSSLQQQNSQLRLNSGVVGYAFGAGSGEIAAIDLAHQELISVNDVSSLDGKFLWYADSRLDQLNRAWAGEHKTGQLFVIDPVKASVGGTVQLPGRWVILIIELDPQGKFAYVLNLLVAPNASDADLAKTNVKISDIAPSIIYKVDTSTLQVVGSVEVARMACDIGISPDGRFLYTPNQLDTLVTVVDLSTFSVVGQIQGAVPGPPIGGSMLTVSPKGDLIFLENSPAHNWSGIDIEGQNAEIVIDTTTQKVIKTIPFDETPGIDQFSPDGKFCTVTLVSKIAIIDTATLSVVATPTVNGPGSGPTYSPDSRFLFMPTTGDKTVQVIDLQTFKTVKAIMLSSAPDTIVPRDLKQQ
jgi:DNA-binding beta-propeller fold protein YncE